jgi:hypothetical protein
MNITVGARGLLALAAIGSVALLTAACGTSSAPSAPATVTVTASPPAGAGTPSTPAASAPATPTPAGPAECTSADLKVTPGGGNGAAGTIYYNIDFTNISGTACFVQGYPGVSLVSAGDGSGSQIGADAKRDSVTPSKQIVLAAGAVAHAVLAIAEAGNFPSSTCHIVTAHWLQIFPPDQTVAQFIQFTTQTCSSTSTPTMRITVVSAGA